MFGVRKDELLRDGNFESDYDVPSTPIVTSDETFVDVDEMNLRKLDQKIDSVVEWIHQFYDRFRYLDEEVGTVKRDIAANKAGVGRLMGSSSGSSGDGAVDIVKLENDIKFLSQKLDASVESIKDVNNGKVQLDNAQMNELSRMNEAVRMNFEKARKIFDEMKSVLLEVRSMKDDAEAVSIKKEAEANRSARIKERNRVEIRPKERIKVRVKQNEQKEYMQLVEEKRGVEVSPSHIVGSREWLRDIKKTSGK